MEAVKEWGDSLWYASNELRNDREVVMEAVMQSGWALEYASERLRKDREVVSVAVLQDPRARTFQIY
jgi:hypothetical protein